MAKAYLNDGIIGNSRMLGCLTSEGELQRLFWPNIDHMQHIDKFEVGVMIGKEAMALLTSPMFIKEQDYIQGTNILNTTYFSEELGLKIIQSDFCLMDQDVMIRQYEIQNLSQANCEIRWVLNSSSVTATSHMTGTLFSFDHEALVHYQRDQYMSVSCDLEAESFQLGGDAFKSLKAGKLPSADSVLMVPEGALTWNLGLMEEGASKSLTMQLCCAHSYKELKSLLTKVRKDDGNKLLLDTKNYWHNYLESLNPVRGSNKQYNDLYERTLLVFRLMYDASSGGLMAAPEADESLEFCGRYAYCWGRDAAFIADALDLCGLHTEVEHFYEFAALTQEENGSWFQRYCLDGNLAPSWGLQIDETGALLYGMWKHYDRTKNEEFLKRLWETVKLAAEFLISFIDPDTGLPKPSRDLWEERWGEHTYSAASVYAGLISSAKMGQCLGTEDSSLLRWLEAAESLKAAIGSKLWDEDQQCFLRGIRTQLYPETKMDGQECIILPTNSKGGMQKVVCKDKVVDVSLIGLSVPFGVLEPEDERMKATVSKLEKALTSERVGGILRYEDDEYMGGNPWILTTLWLALYYTEIREYDKALSYFEWAYRGRTELGLLPEQVSKETGEPHWIVPLTWSHAMYTLVYHALLKENLI